MEYRMESEFRNEIKTVYSYEDKLRLIEKCWHELKPAEALPVAVEPDEKTEQKKTRKTSKKG